jgi:hypothetical protein
VELMTVADSLTSYSLACVAEVEQQITDHLGEHGPTTFTRLHRMTGQPMAYFERAVEALVKRDVARWSAPVARLMCDRKLEIVRSGPALRVWDEYNGWRTV